MTLAARRFSLVALLLASGAFAASGADRHVLVTLRAPLTESARAALAQDGLTLGKPVAGGKFLAMLRPNAKLDGDARIASIERLEAKHKIHPNARGPKSTLTVNVFFHDDVTLDDAMSALDASGAAYDVLLTRFLTGRRIVARVPSHKLDALADDDRVLTITESEKRKVTTRNRNSAILSHVDVVQAAPYGLDGSGVVLSLFDVGEAFAGHGDFGGRLTTHVDLPGYASHPTHVAGTMGGSGAGNFAAKGMAPASAIHQFAVADEDADNDQNLFAKEFTLPPLGVVADNNSWGYVLGWDSTIWQEREDAFGAYSLTFAAPLDRIAIEKNVLFVHAAGNDANGQALDTNGSHYHASTANAIWCYSKNGSGLDCPSPCASGKCETTKHLPIAPWRTIGDQESAKNILLVGAVNADKTLESYSSRGPARDGRVKPDLVAKGNFVLSTGPTGAYYQSSGTSMASPVVTGIAGLLTQQWRMTFGASPSVAQLRTLLIAGAEDRGNVGPDYSYGFGLVDAKASIDLVRADAGAGQRIRSASLAQGQTYAVNVVLDAPRTLRVVLGWSDPDIVFLGGSDFADPALVNDLDVQVIDAGDAIAQPYVLDKNAPAAPATRGANHVDNTEMIEIPDAAAGTYRIVVTATNIAEGPVQPFVLVANAPVSTVPDVALTATGSAAPSVALAWTAAAIGSTYDVYVRSGPGAFALRVAGLTATNYVDAAVSPNGVYLYRILVHEPGGAATWSRSALATTFSAPIAPGQVIQLAHITALTAGANALRALAGLGSIATPGGIVHASHVTNLRAAINEARAALGLAAATFARPSLTGATIAASDFTELLAALE